MPAISNYTRSMKRDIIRIYLDSIQIIFTTTSLIWSRLSSSSNLLQFLLINLRLNRTKKNPPSSKSCQKVISKIKRFQNIFSKKPLQSPNLEKTYQHPWTVGEKEQSSARSLIHVSPFPDAAKQKRGETEEISEPNKRRGVCLEMGRWLHSKQASEVASEQGSGQAGKRASKQAGRQASRQVGRCNTDVASGLKQLSSCPALLQAHAPTAYPHFHYVALPFSSLSLSPLSSTFRPSFSLPPHARFTFVHFLIGISLYLCNGQRSSLYIADENVSGKRANGRPPVHIRVHARVVCERVGGPHLSPVEKLPTGNFY